MKRALRPPTAVLLATALGLTMAPGAPGVRGDAPPGRYEVSDETVRDSQTGLLWQRSVSADGYTWAQATAYCAGLTLAGQSGWRVPMVKELRSLVDERRSRPAIDEAAFPGTPVEEFWTAVPHASDPSLTWVVSFYSGGVYQGLSGNLSRVRCVR